MLILSYKTGEGVSTPWELSNAAYATKTKDISPETVWPKDIRFKSDGTKMYLAAVDVGAVGTDDGVISYTLSTPWDVTTASYDTGSLVNINSLDPAPTGLYIKPDGTKMFITARNLQTILSYTMSTPWDLTTATYDSAQGSISQDNFPNSIYFKTDGTKVFVSGDFNNRVYEYALSVAWDITSISFTTSKDVSANQAGLAGLVFKSDGTKMFISDTNTSPDSVSEYTLSTAWDITSASFVQQFDVSSQDTGPVGVDISPDGTNMYMLGQGTDAVYQYTL